MGKRDCEDGRCRRKDFRRNSEKTLPGSGNVRQQQDDAAVSASQMFAARIAQYFNLPTAFFSSLSLISSQRTTETLNRETAASNSDNSTSTRSLSRPCKKMRAWVTADEDAKPKRESAGEGGGGGSSPPARPSTPKDVPSRHRTGLAPRRDRDATLSGTTSPFSMSATEASTTYYSSAAGDSVPGSPPLAGRRSCCSQHSALQAADRVLSGGTGPSIRTRRSGAWSAAESHQQQAAITGPVLRLGHIRADDKSSWTELQRMSQQPDTNPKYAAVPDQHQHQHYHHHQRIGTNNNNNNVVGSNESPPSEHSPRSSGSPSASPELPPYDSRRKSSEMSSSTLDVWESVERVQASAMPGLAGLRNACNDCYINSPMQCLSATLPFVRYFLSGHHVRDQNPTMRQKRGPNMAHAVSIEITKLFRTIWEPIPRKDLLSCSELKKVLGVLNPVYRDDAQEDAYEFLQFLIQTLHEELDRNPPEQRVLQVSERDADDHQHHSHGEKILAETTDAAKIRIEQASNNLLNKDLIDGGGNKKLAPGLDLTSSVVRPPSADLVTKTGVISNNIRSADRTRRHNDHHIDHHHHHHLGENEQRHSVDVPSLSANTRSTPPEVSDTTSSANSSTKSRVRISMLKRPTPRNSQVPISSPSEYWSEFYKRTNSVVTDLFYGLIVLQDTCSVCKRVHKKFEPMNSLYLPIVVQEDPVTLEACVSAFFAREEIRNFHCQSCDSRSTAIRNTTLYRSPDILVLRVNRDFNRLSAGKVDTPIDVESDVVDLSRFASPEAEKQCFSYELYAVCNHYGSIQTGHYTAHVKLQTQNGTWYRLDDDKIYEKIAKAPDKMAIEPYEVYILFFQRLDGPLTEEQRKIAKARWSTAPLVTPSPT